MRASSTAELPSSESDISDLSSPMSRSNDDPIGKFPFSDRMQADIARMAGRVNAARISDEEMAKLFAEHAELVKKKYDEGISFEAERRLTYIRWTLDRIEDALHGEELDYLEGAVTRYEDFCRRLSSFSQELKSARRK